MEAAAVIVGWLFFVVFWVLPRTTRPGVAQARRTELADRAGALLRVEDDLQRSRRLQTYLREKAVPGRTRYQHLLQEAGREISADPTLQWRNMRKVDGELTVMEVDLDFQVTYEQLARFLRLLEEADMPLSVSRVAAERRLDTSLLRVVLGVQGYVRESG
jgi:hypothetical protein